MNVILPSGVTTPPPEQDLFVVRGDVWTLTLGFTGVEDVVALPSAHRLRIAFRRRQNDLTPDLVTAQAVLEIEPEGETFNGVPIEVMATFTLTTDNTMALPTTGCFYFIEWTDAVGGSNRRVVQGRARTGD